MDRHELAIRYHTWSIAQLIRATTVDARQYDPIAIELMSAELDQRGISEMDRDHLRLDVETEISEETTNLSGVRGWLLVFLLFVALNSVVAIVAGVSTITQPDPAFRTLAGLTLAGGVYGLFALTVLLREVPSAPMHARRWIWATVSIGVFQSVLFYSRFGSLQSVPLFLFVSAALWLEYLSRSERVQATYSEMSSSSATGAGFEAVRKRRARRLTER